MFVNGCSDYVAYQRGDKFIFCKIDTGGKSSAGYERSKIDPFNFGADKISQF